MPKPKDKRDLYEKCWGCDGTRKLVRAAHIDETRTKSRNARPGEACPLCEDGYTKVGVTAGQLERLVAHVDSLVTACQKVAAMLHDNVYPGARQTLLDALANTREKA